MALGMLARPLPLHNTTLVFLFLFCMATTSFDSVEAADTTNNNIDMAGTRSTMADSVFPWMLRAGGVAVGLVAVAGGLLYHKQESLLYFPEIGGIPRSPGDNPRGYRSPHDRQFPFDNVRMKCRDGVTIHGWLLKYTQNGDTPVPHRPTILFFHGNAGNIGLRLPNAMRMVQALESNVLLVEYRGYGDSDSVPPTEAGLKLDAQAALDYVQNERADLDSNLVFAFGRSLGGAVALDLARVSELNPHRPPLAGVAVENTFTSISDMVDQVLPVLTPIKKYVLRIGWRSGQIVQQLRRVPVLYLAGNRDELVPHAHMQQLHGLSMAVAQQSGGPAPSWHIIDGGHHNDSWEIGGVPYWKAFAQFVQASCGATGSGTAATAAATQDAPNVIPVMGNNFMDIAKDVAGSSGAANSNKVSGRDKQE